MLAAVVANVSGKQLKHAMKEKDFLPNYLKENVPAFIEKSLEQQRAEWAAFKEKYLAAQNKVL